MLLFVIIGRGCEECCINYLKLFIDFLFFAFFQESDDDLPFACSICRKPFVEPIMTRCGHYFCEKCALSKSKKSKRCFICGENTQVSGEKGGLYISICVICGRGGETG